MTPTERRRRITEVCEFAAHLRPEQRQAYLQEQCAGDEQLLLDVQSALAKYDISSVSFPSPDARRIGRYEITGTIGSGGSGEVFSALDRNVGRVVAIKILNTPGDADLVRRFRAEAKTVANLHHKNIVTVHEYGEENGVPYLVMEYLNGITLQELIRQRSLSLLEKLEIMTEVAEGLQYAHDLGITHRDVKPANIMRLTDDSVKIMDFGIAQLNAERTTRLTQSGLVVGSIMYMAPEQFGGSADALTDVFAYGVTFYELVTGKNPFAATDPVGIIFKIANTDPPPVRSEAPECPEALDRIIRRAIARERDARYSSLADVLSDTRNVLADLRRDQAWRLYSEAEKLYEAGEFHAAKQSVRRALRLDPAQEDARKLRTEIDEAIRRGEALVRAQALMDQVESAVREQRWEAASGLLAEIRELNVSHPKLQGRLDWASSQVDKALTRDRILNEARRGLRDGNLTDAFRLVSEVLAADPGNSSGKDLLQEVRNQMAVKESRRGLDEEAAKAETLLAAGEVDQALFILAELERRHPEFAQAGILRARAEAQRTESRNAQRLAEGTAEIHDLLNHGLHEMALARIGQLEQEFPGNRLLESLRDRASERPDDRREKIERVKTEAESLIARQEYDRAVSLLETAVARLGDDWDLTRLLLQASVARNAEAAAPEMPADPWNEPSRNLDETLKLPTAASPAMRPPPPPMPDPREREIAELLVRVQSLEKIGRHAEAATLLDDAMLRLDPDGRLLEARERLKETIERQQREKAVTQACNEARALRKKRRYDEALQVLEACEARFPGDPAVAGLLAQIRKDREAPARRGLSRGAILGIVAGVLVLAIGILLLVVRPQWNLFPAKQPVTPAVVTKVAIARPDGASTGVRGSLFVLDLHASGTSLPLAWEVHEGDLPPGVTLAPATGRLEGQPTKSGIYIFLVRASDTAGHYGERAVTIEVTEPPEIIATTDPAPVKVPAVPKGGPKNASGGGGSGSLPVPSVPKGGPGPSGGSRVSDSGPKVATPNPNPGTPTAGGTPSSRIPDPGTAAPAPNPGAGTVPSGPVWLADGSDQRRSGFSPYRGPRNPRALWSVDAGNGDLNSPLIGTDGRVYVWSPSGRSLKSVEDGRIVWSLPLSNEEVKFGPDGSLQLTGILGRTRILDRDGTVARNTPGDMRFMGLTVFGGHAYNSNGRRPSESSPTQWYFFRVDDQTWKVEIDDRAGRPVFDTDGIVYIGTNKGTLYAISNAATILWSFNSGEGTTRGLSITRDRDLLAAVGQSLVCVRNGQLRWKFKSEGDGNAFPPIHDPAGNIYFGKGSDFWALNSAGRALWKVTLGGPITTAPAMDRSGRIYVGTATRLYCLGDPDGARVIASIPHSLR